MAKTYRLGVIGFAHMHINELVRRFNELPNVEWVACADTVPAVPEKRETRSTRGWNMKHALNDIGIPKAYDDYQEMLEKENFDIILFCPENARHGEVAEAIAAKGAHMVTEKPMAARLDEARRMVKAANAAGVELMVNWPSTWNPATRTAKKLVDSGAIGDLLEVKWRGGSMGPLTHGSSHPGTEGGTGMLTDDEKGATWWHQAATGGGALLDYCCYGACLSRYYIGEPAIAAWGMKANLNSPYGDADDNAVIAVRFPKAMALLEATWSTVDHGIPTGPILYGNKGTIVISGRDELRLIQEKGQPAQSVPSEPLPAGRTTLAEEFIHHLETGEPLHETLGPRFNLDAQAILDAGIRSAETGQAQEVQKS